MIHEIIGPHYFYDSANEAFVPSDTSLTNSLARHEEHHGTQMRVTPFDNRVSLSPPFPEADADAAEESSSSSSLTKKPSSGSRRKPPGHIPRPRNAFMIFRSEYWAKEKIKPDVEHDHRQISRIAGHYWRDMPEEEKQIWQIKAEMEKIEHSRKYPNYRYNPVIRSTKPTKRNTKRNGESDKLRCRLVADLRLQGAEGDQLTQAVNDIFPEIIRSRECSAETSDVGLFPANVPEGPPPFKSPLLPPTELNMQFPYTPSLAAREGYHSPSSPYSPISDGSAPVTPNTATGPSYAFNASASMQTCESTLHHPVPCPHYTRASPLLGYSSGMTSKFPASYERGMIPPERVKSGFPRTPSPGAVEFAFKALKDAKYPGFSTTPNTYIRPGVAAHTSGYGNPSNLPWPPNNLYSDPLHTYKYRPSPGDGRAPYPQPSSHLQPIVIIPAPRRQQEREFVSRPRPSNASYDMYNNHGWPN